MTSHCVYWVRTAEHTDLTTQGYVGVTACFGRRMKEHVKRTQNRHFWFAIQKYGWDNLVKQQLVIGDEEYCLELEVKLRPKNNVGWNLTKGGGKPPILYGNKHMVGIPAWNKGISHSTETKIKLRDATTKLWEDPEYRQHMSNVKKGRTSPRKGAKLLPESIEKMRLKKIGVPSKKKGILMSAEQRSLMSERIKLISWECPHCNKLGHGLGAKTRWHFDNCKRNPLLAEVA